jgi:hypothetical protein
MEPAGYGVQLARDAAHRRVAGGNVFRRRPRRAASSSTPCAIFRRHWTSRTARASRWKVPRDRRRLSCRAAVVLLARVATCARVAAVRRCVVGTGRHSRLRWPGVSRSASRCTAIPPRSRLRHCSSPQLSVRCQTGRRCLCPSPSRDSCSRLPRGSPIRRVAAGPTCKASRPTARARSRRLQVSRAFLHGCACGPRSPKQSTSSRFAAKPPARSDGDEDDSAVGDRRHGSVMRGGKRRRKKRGVTLARNPLVHVVGDTGFEPVAPAV